MEDNDRKLIMNVAWLAFMVSMSAIFGVGGLVFAIAFWYIVS
jgi:hypothetical protein